MGCCVRRRPAGPPRVRLWFVLAAAAAAGCDNGPARREVSGRVTFNKTPLAKGLVTFDPLDGQTTRTDCLIKDGEYRLGKAEGLTDGKYRVLIIATGGTDPVPVPDGWKGPPPVNPATFPPALPDKYNRASELKLTVAGGPNVHNFDLEGVAQKVHVPDYNRAGQGAKK